MIWKVRKERGFCTKALGRFLELFVAKDGATPPFGLAKTCKKQQAMFVGNC
jgi:hypothetical protein